MHADCPLRAATARWVLSTERRGARSEDLGVDAARSRRSSDAQVLADDSEVLLQRIHGVHDEFRFGQRHVVASAALDLRLRQFIRARDVAGPPLDPRALHRRVGAGALDHPELRTVTISEGDPLLARMLPSDEVKHQTAAVA